MAGRHDRAADESRPGLLATGPIVVRGLTRGVRDALRPGQDSRHRSEVDATALAHAGGGGRDSGAPARPPGDQEEVDVTEQRPSSDPDGDAASGSTPLEPDEDRNLAGDVRADSAEGAHPSAGAEPSAAVRAAVDPRTPQRQEPDPAPDGGSGGRGPARFRERRELVGVAVLVALAVVCAGLIVAVVLKTQADAAAAAREAAAYTPPPLTSTSSAASGPSLAVVADEAATRSASGVSAAGRWPRLLADAVSGEVDLRAGTGAGYTASGDGGTSFVDAAKRIPAQTDVVLFVGGAADADASSLTLARAATEAFSEASQQAPGAVVVAVGPLFRPEGVGEQAFTELRATLRSSARIAGVRWVDPVSSGWLPTVSSASDLTSADERTVARRMRTLVADAG